MSHGRVLFVDDEAEASERLRLHLESLSVDLQVAEGVETAKHFLSTQRFHAVVSALGMPGDGGREILHFVQRQGLQVPVILTGHADEETVEDCLQAGAFDFVSKPLDHLSLLGILRRALLRSDLLFDEISERPTVLSTLMLPDMVGTSDAMNTILWRIAKIAEADTNVCIYGESGTGKELVAHAIHNSGPRANRPLIVLDCAAIPEGLMESEMFGHVKGAFTSAESDRDGVFQLANGGTLFLDEVGELSLFLQAKLLRVLQCREFRKVGGKHPIKVNVRIIAATNKDLRTLVAEGKFREDLFYRLEVIPLTLPPLRQRKEDIPLLVDHFIQKINHNSKKQIRGVSSHTMGVLLRYHWPGNVRELENCIERAAVMAEGNLIEITKVAQVISSNGEDAPSVRLGEKEFRSELKNAEWNLIRKALDTVNGNRTRAADLLGISLRGLHYKIKKMENQRAAPEAAPLTREGNI